MLVGGWKSICGARRYFLRWVRIILGAKLVWSPQNSSFCSVMVQHMVGIKIHVEDMELELSEISYHYVSKIGNEAKAV